MKKVIKFILNYVKILVIAFAIALILKDNVICGAYIVGESMYPTMHENDVIVLNRTVFRKKKVERFDIVSIEGIDLEKTFIKRIIGIPGDIVEIKNGYVYINAKLLEEEYLENGTHTHAYIDEYWEVPEGMVFVLGDNRENSLDSRMFGLVKIDQITGVGIYRYLPIIRAGRLNN